MYRWTSSIVMSAAVAALLSPFAAPSFAQVKPAKPETPETPEMPVSSETIQVTATRTPEDVEVVPVSITVLSGDDLRARGATDLASALSLVGGVTVAPAAGDAGPAAGVPELWGLREVDAYLLVVDGVPRGGAFNPDLASLDLADVERIEILRGSAPVMFGATSFIGVIHVIHYGAGKGERRASVSGGSYGSGSASVVLPFGADGSPWKQSLAASYDDQGFKDDRTGFRRGTVLYRAARRVGEGHFSLDLEGQILNQDPASPHPRVGTELSDEVPLDSNVNPDGAKLDQDRYQAVARYDRPVGAARWSTTLSATHSKSDILRGFLTQVADVPDNAAGFTQDRKVDDVYFDTHLSWALGEAWHFVAGVDHLYGKGTAESVNFKYEVELEGDAPHSDELDRFEAIDFEDTRDFSGLYLQSVWDPHPRWHVELGARVNRTSEDRSAMAEPIGDEMDAGGDGGEEGGESSLDVTRGSGFAGVTFLAWTRDDDGLWLYADYRNTYKPAAVDFGPEAEGDILDPETAHSYEVGVKSRTMDGRLDWDLSLFRMDFDNLVVSQASPNGLPELVNAGQERFDGAELESELQIVSNLRARLAASYHDAKFRNYERLFDGVPFQLRGNRLELSAKQMGSFGLIWAPPRGLQANAMVGYVGSRFLDKRNRAKADPYTTWDAGVGYRWSSWQLRADGRNLGDARDPVAESELGDAQYYLLPARSYRLTLSTTF